MNVSVWTPNFSTAIFISQRNFGSEKLVIQYAKNRNLSTFECIRMDKFKNMSSNSNNIEKFRKNGIGKSTSILFGIQLTI